MPIPPPPPGFELSKELPPPPPGFAKGLPPPPPGFEIETPSPSLKERAQGFAMDVLRSGGGPMGFLSTATRPVGEAALAMGTGAVAKPVADVAGLAALGVEMAQGQGGDPGEFRQDVQEAMTYEPRTKGGKLAAEYNPLALLGKGVGWLAKGAGKLVRGDEPSTAPRGVAGNILEESIQQAPGFLGQKIAASIPEIKGKGSKIADDVKAARELGYKITPEEARADIISREISGATGDAKLAAKISEKNIDVHGRVIAEDLGLPVGEELSAESLSKAKQESFAAYEEVRNSGRVTADKAYFSDLDKVNQTYTSAAKGFPKAVKDEIGKLVKSLKERAFGASEAVDMIKVLREQADKNFRVGDTSLGRANRKAAEALESQIERHLVATGQNPAILGNYKSARVRLAKIGAAEKALNPTTGEINAQVYKRMLEKGKPLTGGARQVGEFARAFPRSSQAHARSKSTGTGWGDLVIAGLGKHVPLMFARPIMRSVIASEPYQNWMTTPSKTLKAMEAIRASQAVPGVTLGEMAVARGTEKDQKDK